MNLPFIADLERTRARTAERAGGTEPRYTPASTNTFLLVPILLLFALMVVAVVRSPNLLSSEGVGSAVIVVTPLILATFALTPVVMAGRAGVDLSIGPLIGFINVTLVQLFAAGVLETGFEFFIYAIAVGIAYQVLMGLIIYFGRIQPIIVALSGYLVLAGLNLIVLPRPGGSAPEWMQPWGQGTTIWSPVLLVLAVALAGWFLFTRTAFYDHLRLMGSDERTAYSAGVNIVAVRLGAHAIAGVFAALSALTFTSLISSGDPTQGTTYTLLAVTALVLGGTSLAGGRGSIIGSMLGALNIYLITYVLATFNFGKVQSFVTQLSYGVVLVLALLLTLFLPRLQQATRGLSPLAVFLVLAMAMTGVTLHVKDKVITPTQTASSGLTSLASQSSSGTSLASQSSSGTSLASQSSTGTSLASQSSTGTSLASQSSTGTSLASQSSTGTSLASQSSSGTSLAGQSLAGASADEQKPEPRGTGVVVAVVIVAILAGLAFLLYRFPGIPTFGLVGILALILIGYAAYDPSWPSVAERTAESVRAQAPAIFNVEGPLEAVNWSAAPLVGSPLASIALVLLGAVLVGSVLIFSTVTYQQKRIGAPAMGLIVLAAIVVVGIVIFESGMFDNSSNHLFNGAISALIVGALLFIPTLPTFHLRGRSIMPLMLTLLGLSALGAMVFAVREQQAPAMTDPTGIAPPPAQTGTTAPVAFPEWFYVTSWTVLILAVIVFLLAIPSVRRHILRDIGFEQTIRRISYLGLFIAGFAVLAMGALFFVGNVPIWKFATALVAAVIFARVIWHFLGDFMKRRDPLRNDMRM